MVSFTPRPLYFRRKCPQYPLSKYLGRTQSPSGQFGERKKYLAAGRNRPTVPRLSSPWPGHYTDWAVPGPPFFKTTGVVGGIETELKNDQSISPPLWPFFLLPSPGQSSPNGMSIHTPPSKTAGRSACICTAMPPIQLHGALRNTLGENIMPIFIIDCQMYVLMQGPPNASGCERERAVEQTDCHRWVLNTDERQTQAAGR
jgi:hypothetical protein